MRHLTIPVTEFKAKCLALLDQVEKNGTTLTVTKRGRPFVTVRPMEQEAWKSTEGVLSGKGTIPDSVEGFELSHDWKSPGSLRGDL